MVELNSQYFSIQLSCEIKHLLSQIEVLDKIPMEEILIIEDCIKRYEGAPEKMLVEDLCALDKLSEEKISELLKERLERGESYTFVGDVLVSLNSNEFPNEFPRSVSRKRSKLFILKCKISKYYCRFTESIIANLVRTMLRTSSPLPIVHSKICSTMKSLSTFYSLARAILVKRHKCVVQLIICAT